MTTLRHRAIDYYIRLAKRIRDDPDGATSNDIQGLAAGVIFFASMLPKDLSVLSRDSPIDDD